MCSPEGGTAAIRAAKGIMVGYSDSASDVSRISTPRETRTDSADSWRKGLRLEAFANLAHELRTPVQVLLGYVDILRDDHRPEFSRETFALLERMNANIHDLAQTVDNLMHFALSQMNAESAIDEHITPASLIAEITPV